MKAILLAAGVGSRIAKHISQKHKCLLSVTGQDAPKPLPLIEYTITMLKKYGIQDISIVTGYHYQDIEKTTLPYHVQCIYNPFYYLVNSIGSLWFASNIIKHSQEDILILNADTFMEESLIKTLITQNNITDNPLLLVDSSIQEQADVKVTYHNNTLELYGKEIEKPSMAESLDVVIIPKSLTSTFHTQLQEMIENHQHDTWWESVLIENKDTVPITIQDIAGSFWREIDHIEDYHKICNFYSEK